MPKDPWIDEHGFRNIVEGQQGIFDAAQPALGGDSAMASYAKATTSPTREGLKIEFQCENCGNGRILVAEWPELIACKYGLQPHVAYGPLAQRGIQVVQSPAAWGYDQENQAWFPDLRCRCSWPSRPLVSLQEIEQMLRAAVSRGFLSQIDNKKLSDHCFAMAQQMQQQGGGGAPMMGR
jgi:hypothetical protein